MTTSLITFLFVVGFSTNFVFSDVLKEDEGLIRACAHYKGTLTEISPNGLTGPRCSVALPIPTDSEYYARLACDLYMPGKRIQSTPGPTTHCLIEATLRCKPGWINMFNHCYKLISFKNHTKAEAEGACAALGANIAQLRHRYALGSLKRYFRRISQVWLKTTESLEKYAFEITKDSNAFGLAFNGMHYDFNVPKNSIVRIDPEFKLQALCEYQPPLMLSEIRYLGDRYSEIYHKTIMVENGLIIRSGSMYTRPKQYNDLCLNVMKALQTKQVVDFNPNDEALHDLVDFKGVSFTRSAAVAVFDEAKMRQPQCVHEVETYNVPSGSVIIANYKVNFKGNEPSMECDNMRSVAIVHPKTEKDSIVRTMTDSVSAPIWCKLGFTKKFVYDVPPGWNLIVRDDGTPVAHKFYSTPLAQWDAQKKCEEEGTILSGFTSHREMEFLIGLMPDHIKNPSLHNNQRVSWLGARKNGDCGDFSRFSDDKNHKCSRRKWMKWEKNAANTYIDESYWLNDSRTRLNPTGHGQDCMTLIRDRNQKWAERRQPGNLDDISCPRKFSFICQRKVTVVAQEDQF